MAQQVGFTSNRRHRKSSGSAARSRSVREHESLSRRRNGGTSENDAWAQRRPEFMRSLGLLPPCTVEDVKQAYLERVKTVHPDLGGNVAAFCRLQEDFERAIEHVKFRSSPLRWIAAQVGRYVVQQGVIARIIKLGGSIDWERVDWLKDSYGVDFAQLAEKVVGIHLREPGVGDEILAYLARQPTLVPNLRKLDVAYTRVTDEGLKRLRVFTSLRWLNLEGTHVTDRGLDVLRRLPALGWLNVKGTSISWWGLAKLRWRGPALSVVTPDGRFKTSRNGSSRAAGNGMCVQDGHVALLAKIAEIRSRKH